MLRRYGCRGLQYRPGILIFDGTLYGRGAYTETAMTKKLTFALLALGLLACAPRPAGPVDYVDPFIGTGYHGHTYPGATTPFGMVQLSPDTRAGDLYFIILYRNFRQIECRKCNIAKMCNSIYRICKRTVKVKYTRFNITHKITSLG